MVAVMVMVRVMVVFMVKGMVRIMECFAMKMMMKIPILYTGTMNPSSSSWARSWSELR